MILSSTDCNVRRKRHLHSAIASTCSMGLNMPSLKLLTRVLFAAYLFTWCSSSCLAFQDESALEQFGRMLGGALRGEQVEQPMIQRMEVFEAQPAEKREVPEGEREEFKTRVTAYSNAMFDWLVTTCEIPEAERQKLHEVFDVHVKKHCEVFEKSGRGNQEMHQQAFPKVFPLLFTQEDSIGPDFRDAVLTQLRSEVLTEPQKQKLDDALNERAAFRVQAFAGFLTALIDRELFLTDQQRTQLSEQMQNSKKPLKHTLYSFQAQSYYLPYENMSTLLSRASAKEVLDAAQRKRLTDLSGSDPNGNIVFQAADGMESWHDQMNQMARRQREVFIRAASVRIAWLEKELQLSPEQVQALNVASKGAAVRAIGDWKEQTQQTLDQMEQQMAQMGGNFGFGAQSIDSSSIDNNELWTDNLKDITEGKAAERLKQRKVQQNEIIAKCLIALFDDELWLTPAQRNELLPVFAKSLPKSQDPVQYYEYIRELIWVAYPLFKTDKPAREAILSESQETVWARIESFYNYQQSNNYVQIQLRNQGGSFGFMLQP